MCSEDEKPNEAPAQPAKAPSPFEAWVGRFPYFKTTEENIKFWRDLRGHDEFDDQDIAAGGQIEKSE